MKFKPIETCGNSAQCCSYEIGFDAIQICARGLARGLRNIVDIRNRRSGHEWPIIGGEREIDAFPTTSSGTFAPGVTQLKRNFGGCMRVHEIDDTLPGVALFVVPHSRTSGRNSRLGGD